MHKLVCLHQLQHATARLKVFSVTGTTVRLLAESFGQILNVGLHSIWQMELSTIPPVNIADITQLVSYGVVYPDADDFPIQLACAGNEQPPTSHQRAGLCA